MSADSQTKDGAPKRQWRRLEVLEGGAAPSSGRVLPHSLEAEENLLASCLLDGRDVVARCALARLTPAAFYDPKHGILFEILLEMFSKNIPIGIDTLAEELKLRRQLDAVGGYAFLTQVSDRIPTTAQAGYFIERVREQGLLRAAIRDFTGVVEECFNFSGNLDQLLGRCALKAQRLADFSLRAKQVSQVELAQQARLTAAAVADGKIDKSRWLHLGGLPYADQAFLPFDVRNEDWLTLVAAPPSGGKSTLLRQHVAHNLVDGKRFVVFLLETSARRWLQAMAAMFAGVNLRELDQEPRDRVKNFDGWMAEIEGWMETRLWIFDDVFFLEDIERQVRELNRRLREQDLAAGKPETEARGLDGVVGDYLQLLNTRERFRQREEQVAYMSRTLKRLHKGIDVPGFWAVQLNRAPRAEGRRPKLTDLRESGALEQDADRVHMLHTPAENKAGVAQDGTQLVDEVELIQAKSRNGPRDIFVDLMFHKRSGRYEDASPKGTPRPGAPKPAGGYKREAKP